MDSRISILLEQLRYSLREAINNSEDVCAVVAALGELGWSPSLALDLTLAPTVQEHPAPSESYRGEATFTTSDAEFLQSLGIAPVDEPSNRVSHSGS